MNLCFRHVEHTPLAWKCQYAEHINEQYLPTYSPSPPHEQSGFPQVWTPEQICKGCVLDTGTHSRLEIIKKMLLFVVSWHKALFHSLLPPASACLNISEMIVYRTCPFYQPDNGQDGMLSFRITHCKRVCYHSGQHIVRGYVILPDNTL